MHRSPATLALFLALLLLPLSAGPARAQAPGLTFGVGGQIGDPSGLSFKFYERPDLSYDFLLAFDLNDDFTFLNAHRTWERVLSDSPVRLHYGPGLFVGFVDRGGDDDDDLGDDEALFGISFKVGLNVFIDRFEVFLNLTPRLLVLPETDGALGAGVGLHYYF